MGFRTRTRALITQQRSRYPRTVSVVFRRARERFVEHAHLNASRAYESHHQIGSFCCSARPLFVVVALVIAVRAGLSCGCEPLPSIDCVRIKCCARAPTNTLFTHTHTAHCMRAVPNQMCFLCMARLATNFG